MNYTEHLKARYDLAFKYADFLIPLIDNMDVGIGFEVTGEYGTFSIPLRNVILSKIETMKHSDFSASHMSDIVFDFNRGDYKLNAITLFPSPNNHVVRYYDKDNNKRLNQEIRFLSFLFYIMDDDGSYDIFPHVSRHDLNDNAYFAELKEKRKSIEELLNSKVLPESIWDWNDEHWTMLKLSI